MEAPIGDKHVTAGIVAAQQLLPGGGGEDEQVAGRAARRVEQTVANTGFRLKASGWVHTG